MGQRWNAESVGNFVIFLLILQNCGLTRTQSEIERELHQKRDGLAKFEFSGSHGNAASADTLHAFHFASIYETLYATLLQPSAGQGHGRAFHPPQTQLLWQMKPENERSVVLITTRRPFHVLSKLQQDLEEKLKQSTTAKPFNVLQHLAQEQIEQLQQRTPNASFNLLQKLQMEQDKRLKYTSTVKPFHLLGQLDKDLQEHENTIEESHSVSTEPNAPLEQHKAVPAEATRAKDSQKRKRKRIRRRRKRIRRRRKRKRRRDRKKRKKRRKKRKKKKDKKDKKDKKKKKRKKRRRKPTTPDPPLAQQAQVIFANPTKQPYHHHAHHDQPTPPQIQTIIVTTKKPATTPAPFSKIKFLLRHNSLFKKKKKEYLNHVGHVIYPFVKWIVFFTVLNPFTLGVFLFTILSPAVFGFIGFVALSILVKPFLHLVFGVKQNVDNIDRRRYLAHKRAERLKLNLRPVTIHKHYYQQKPLHSTPPIQLRPVQNWRRNEAQPTLPPRHNPLLPAQRAVLAGARPPPRQVYY